MDSLNQSNTNKRGVIAVVLLLLLGSLIGNIVFFSKQRRLNSERNNAVLHSDSLLSVKLQVEKHLNEAQAALNNCKTDKNELNTTIVNLKTEISEKQTIIEKNTKDNNNIVSLRKQLKDAKKLRDDCETQVNMILSENGNLQDKIISLNKTLADITKDNEDFKKKLEWQKK